MVSGQEVSNIPSLFSKISQEGLPSCNITMAVASMGVACDFGFAGVMGVQRSHLCV